jgi:hypothetical protein
VIKGKGGDRRAQLTSSVCPCSSERSLYSPDSDMIQYQRTGGLEGVMWAMEGEPRFHRLLAFLGYFLLFYRILTSHTKRQRPQYPLSPWFQLGDLGLSFRFQAA